MSGLKLKNHSDFSDWPGLLVTGANGFIGHCFCSRYGGMPFEDTQGRIDLVDSLRVETAIDSVRPDAVLHFAAQSSVASSFKDPHGTYNVNFIGTLNLLESLSAVGFSGVFIYVSSADVYGAVDDQHLPVTELLHARPRSPYAVSKVAAEALCYQWSQTHNLRMIIVRPFNQIGPGHDVRFAIPHFAQQIIDIRRGFHPPVITTGDLEVTRDFTDVRDTARALRLLLQSGVGGESYNICSGKERPLSSILGQLLQLAGVEAEIRLDPSRVRVGEQRRMVGDPSKLREHVGWASTIAIEETLQDILNDLEIK